MLLVIQPLKKYLTEHESETLSTCYDKYLASCQDAQRPLSKTASLPEGKCILLLYLVLLSTVQQWVTNKDMNITWPIAFTLCYAAVVCSINNGSEYGYRGAIIPTATGCTSRYVRNARNGDPDYLTELNYIAIGIISR